MLHVDYAGFDRRSPLRHSILLGHIAQVSYNYLFICGKFLSLLRNLLKRSIEFKRVLYISSGISYSSFATT